ncbi:centrosomal protein of 192 kDa-like isoform X2 [Ptychodera flava]|uniref:centrosomal protein of 192 kDa-like isoform X2 n=1 Tax=Ptychodera flava TaxID=63121 RepID=UPI003969F18E
MSQELPRSQTGSLIADEKSLSNESGWSAFGTPVAASTMARPRQPKDSGNMNDSNDISGMPSLQNIDLSGISLSSDEQSRMKEPSNEDRESFLAETSSLGLIPEDAMEGLSMGLLQVEEAKEEDNISERTITPVAWHCHFPMMSVEGVVPESSPEEKSFRNEFRESLEESLGVRVAATGVESDHSEIDTEDELEAARQEIAQQQREQYLSETNQGEIETEDSRPGLEGDSTEEDDNISTSDSLERDIKPLSHRQSGEGDVSASPVPGDGGGGGDGSSGGGGSSNSSDIDSDGDGDTPGFNDRQDTMAVLRRLGLVGDGEDIPFPSPPGMDGNTDLSSAPSRMRPTGGDDPVQHQVRFVSPIRTSTQSSQARPSSASSYGQSADPDATPKNADLISSKFLKPSSRSFSNDTVDDSAPWSPDASSFHMSDIFSLGHDQVGEGQESGMDNTLTAGSDLDDTLVTNDDIRRGEGNEDKSPPNPFIGRSSLGSFGLGTGDFTHSHNISFGDDDFSQLEPALSQHSSHSRESKGSSHRRHEERAEVQGAESGEEDFDSAIVANQPRKAPAGDDSGSPPYIVDNGEIVTELAFQSSLPADDAAELSGFEDFGIQSDEEFVTGDHAVNQLDVDEQNFAKENVFIQDAMASTTKPAANDSPGFEEGWGLHDGAVLKFNDITGQEDFCRISIGGFLGSRSEALGSLSQTDPAHRPSFGDGTIVTPPHTNGPIALINTHDSQVDDRPLDGSYMERMSGVGEYLKEESYAPPKAKDLPQSHTRTSPAGDGTDATLKGKIKQLEESISGADMSVSISSIASAIAQAASSSTPEELSELIKHLSQKRIRKDEPDKTSEVQKQGMKSEIQGSKSSKEIHSRAGVRKDWVDSSKGQKSHDHAQPITGDTLPHDRLFKPINGDSTSVKDGARKPATDTQSRKDLKAIEVYQMEEGIRRLQESDLGMHAGQQRLKYSPKKLSGSLQTLNRSGQRGSQSSSPQNLLAEETSMNRSQSLPELMDPQEAGRLKPGFGSHPRYLNTGKDSMEAAKKEQLQKYLNDSDPSRIPLTENELKFSELEGKTLGYRGDGKANGSAPSSKQSSKEELYRIAESQKYMSKRPDNSASMKSSTQRQKESVRSQANGASKVKINGIAPDGNRGAVGNSGFGKITETRDQKGKRKDSPSLTMCNLPDDEKQKSPGQYRPSSSTVAKTQGSLQPKSCIKSPDRTSTGKSTSVSPRRSSPGRSPGSSGKSPGKSPGRSSGYASILEQKAAIAQTLSTPLEEGESPKRVSFIGKGKSPDFNEQSVLDSSTPKRQLFKEKSQEGSISPFARSGGAVTVKQVRGSKDTSVANEEVKQAPVVSSFKLFDKTVSTQSNSGVPTLLTSQTLMNTSVANTYLNSRATTTHPSHRSGQPGPSSVANKIPPISSTMTSLHSAPSGRIPDTSTASHMSTVSSWPGSVYQPIPGHIATVSSAVGAGTTLSTVYSNFRPQMANTMPHPPTGAIPTTMDIAAGVVIPGELRFIGVCCVGIAVQTTLPIHNTIDRWVKCTMDVVTVLANGAQIDLDNYCPFIVKNSAIIPPGKTEDTTIMFAPRHPGIFVAQLQIYSSPVVNATMPSVQDNISIVTVHAIAEKPNIQVEVDDSERLDFGDVVHGKDRSKALKLYNKGRSTVPVRLIISASSVAWHCFSFGQVDNRIEYTSPSSKKLTPRGSSILSLTLPGKADNRGAVEPMLVWIDFKAPQRNLDHVTTLANAEIITARIDVELDTPSPSNNIASRKLQATVGCARLHIPKDLLNKSLGLSAPVSKTATQFLPVKNAGNLPATVELKVTRAQEFYSVIPSSMTLQPNEVTDIVVKFTPVDAPVTIDSMLLMTIQPDGPEYEVHLKGEGSIPGQLVSHTAVSSLKSEQSEQKNMLLCNKQFVAWGGVPVGRALQQRVVLRNDSGTELFKLKVSIKAEHTDFQLQSSFGGEETLGDNREVILKPLEDFPVHILFAPTSVTCRQAKLIMRPQNGGMKYVIPLTGYGGISNLVIQDLDTMGSTFVSNLGPIAAGEHKVIQVIVQNTGPRAAFVKAIAFEDLGAKTKLSKSVLIIEPSEFVVPAKNKGAVSVTVVLNTTDRETSICLTKSNVVASVGFFYGDEITRQQFRRVYKKSSSKAVKLSDSNPLKGVNFDTPYIGEDYIYEVNELPPRSNDVQLFYSCMSRMMLALVGSPDTDAMEADATCMSVVPELIPHMDQTVLPETKDRASVTSRVMHTPPTRGSRASDTDIALSTGPIKASSGSNQNEYSDATHWEITPQFIILSATSDIQTTVSKSRLQLVNYTERKLSFEMNWPGHCVTVSPQTGIVDSRSLLLIFVSTNPSIVSKGIQLPWRGSIFITCDGVTKEIKVQIRPDLAMDTSLNPVPHRELHMLYPNPSATPGVPISQPSTGYSPAIKVLAKRIEFPVTRTGESSETSIEFESSSSDILRWGLSSIAPAYVKQDNKDVYRATYTAFRFAKQSGSITPGQSIKIPVSFLPRDIGCYAQYWELEVNSIESVAFKVQQTKIELAGESVKAASAATKTHRRGPLAPGVLVRKEIITPSSSSATTAGASDSGYVSRSHISKSKILDPQTESSAYLGVVLPKQCLEFPTTEAGKVCKLKFPIKNEGTSPHTLNFVNPRPPFYINHHSYLMKPRHYVSLPVSFKPERPGIYESLLVIATDVEHSLVAKLYGECV